MKLFIKMMIVMFAVTALYGCAKKADANKPIEQIQAEVATMSVSDLESTAKAYAQEIVSKKSEAEKVANELKGLSMQEMLGEKAKSIKDRVSTIGDQISKLTERYKIYADKFQAAGGDVSKIQIQ